MRWIRTFIILFFILAAAVFGVSRVQEFRERDETIPVITSDREILEIPCDYTQEQLMEAIDRQYRYEFMGEGVRFHFCKRLNLTVTAYDGSQIPDVGKKSLPIVQ